MYSLKSGLANFKFKNNSGKAQYSMNGGTSWTNFRNPVGTAAAADVLAGKTFANASSDSVAGTMINRGAWNSSPTASGKVTIPAGYHNGSGYVNTAGVYTAGYNAGKTSGGFTRILSNYRTYETVKSWTETDDDETKKYVIYAMKVATNTSKSVNDFIIEPVQGDNIFNGCSCKSTRHLYFAKAKINNNIYVQCFGDVEYYDQTMTDGLYAFYFQFYPKVKMPINVYQKS